MTRVGAIAAAALLSLAACAPPPDAVPALNPDQADKLSDLHGDLQALMRGEDISANDIANTIDGLTRFPPTDEATRRLAEALVQTARTARLDEERSGRLAFHIYEVMNGGYLTRAQLSALSDEIDAMLRSAGTPDASRAALRTAAERAARDIRSPRTDWW